MKPHEVPLNSADIEVKFSIREAGEEYEPYFDLQPLAEEVYNSRPEEHKYGDFHQWYSRLMRLEDEDRLELTIYKGTKLIAAAVFICVEDVHYGSQVSEVFRVTDGTREAAKELVKSYRAASKVMGFDEYLTNYYRDKSYIRKIRRVHGRLI